MKQLSAVMIAGAVTWSATAWAQTVARAPQAGSANTPVVFRGVTVIDVRKGQHLPDQTVVVIGHRIQTVKPSKQARVPKGALVVDARGKYLIPGLWDMHSHSMRWTDVTYPLFIANGVTGTRDAGSEVPLATLVQWKREIAAGSRVGPRLIVAGPMVEPGGLDSGTIVASDSADQPGYVYVPRKLARYLVDSLKAAGADYIKTYGSPPEVAAEARRVGLRFGGHATIDGLQDSDSGATFLDHQTWLPGDRCGESSPDSLDMAQCTAAAERFRRNNTWIVLQPHLFTRAGRVARMRPYVPASFPWLNNWGPRSGPEVTTADSQTLAAEPASTEAWKTFADTNAEWVAEKQKRRFALRRAGMPLLLGTDALLFPIAGRYFYCGTMGFSVPDVLQGLVVLEGLSPLEALQTATLNPALALQATDSLGTVEAGKLADLVLLDADPLADIWNVRKIRAVVANGRYFDRAGLDGLLTQAQQTAARR